MLPNPELQGVDQIFHTAQAACSGPLPPSKHCLGKWCRICNPDSALWRTGVKIPTVLLKGFGFVLISEIFLCMFYKLCQCLQLKTQMATCKMVLFKAMLKPWKSWVNTAITCVTISKEVASLRPLVWNDFSIKFLEFSHSDTVLKQKVA